MLRRFCAVRTPWMVLGLSLSCLLTGRSLPAESRTFPYEASVRSAEVDVRSGPGQRYYVTGRVRLNDRVTVHRHDPGGWYMITPPAGSFSYIDAALVRKTGDASGLVEVPPTETGETARAIVRIGSEISDDHTYYGRELANGDEVRILGEKLLNTDRGAVRMYRIAPPSLEYRWVKGDFIVADSGEVRTPAALEPLTSVTTPAGTPNAPEFPTNSLEALPTTSRLRPATQAGAAPLLSTTTTSSSPPITFASGPREALASLDQRYIELTRQTPEHWDLDTLVNEYHALRIHADASQRDQIDQRLEALESRRKVWTEYQDFVRLTAETAQRDASLLALQTGIPPEAAVPAGTIAAEPMPSPYEPMLGTPEVVPASATQPVPMTPGSPMPPMTPAGTPQAGGASTPKLDGAGIVQRMPTGRRGQYVHVLADSQGRVLALLQAPPNMGLDRYLGQSLGVVGQRYFDPRVRSDVINVRQILPVQLAQ